MRKAPFCTRISIAIVGLFMLTQTGICSTTVIVERTEERRSTRWTLTEWLRIKERMKLMDTWMAMFSNPKKDTFRPELNITYHRLDSQADLTNGSRTTTAQIESTHVAGQLWLTNLISSTLGIRTLNVDLGFGSSLVQGSGSYSDNNTAASTLLDSDLRQNTVLFRIFGRSIQDSSIQLKIGEYNTHRIFFNTNGTLTSATFSGTTIGAHLELYLSHWLGISYSYDQLQQSTVRISDNNTKFSGSSHSYGVFIEVSIIRLEAGLLSNSSSIRDEAGVNQTNSKRTGQYAGITLHY